MYSICVNYQIKIRRILSLKMYSSREKKEKHILALNILVLDYIFKSIFS